jgi:hypothetical protein
MEFASSYSMRTFICASIFGASLLAFACTGAAPSSLNTGPVVTGSGLTVTVALASATLGDENCGSVGGGSTTADRSAGICAPLPDGGPANCPSYCSATSVQLSFTSSASGNPAKAKVTRVVLLDADTNTELDTLAAAAPTFWDGSSYVAWDGSIKGGADIKASYTLEAPSWSSITSSSKSNVYSKQYRIQVTVEIDGASTTVTSQPTTRAAQVST